MKQCIKAEIIFATILDSRIGNMSAVQLSEYLKQHQNGLPAKTAAKILLQLTDAVQHAHDQGVLHRDISASYDYFIRERRSCLWLSANIASDCLQVEMMEALFRGISRPSFSCQRRQILPFQPEVSRIRRLVRVVTYCSSWICFSRSWMNGSNFAMSAALLPCSCLRKPNR